MHRIPYWAARAARGDRWRGWAHTVGGSKVKRRRSLGELKGRLLQAGEGTRRSEKAKVSEEALRRQGGGGGPMERRTG
jgi:hypothetical protein